MTRLCVPIFVESIEQAKRDIATALEAGAEMLELRIDGFDGDAATLLQGSILPTIVTNRSSEEGGLSNSTDAERITRLSFLAENAKYIDIELATLKRTGIGRDQFASDLIVSAHDFRGRPGRLMNVLTELIESPGDVAKIVWMPRSIRDNIEAFEILQNRQKPTIALCMGEAGLISRVLAKKFGAFLTFASLRDESATAPGQVTIHDMKRLYRWDAISPATKVYGVVGSPVMHSMSPAIHNASFDQVGHDGVYLPLLVNPGYESFKAFMESFLDFEPLHLSGLSVTIPHKENALRYLKEKGAQVEELAERIGAVNTVVVRDGKLSGYNTDYHAILDTITRKLNIPREKLSELRVAVIGAGGTGRTAVAALAHYGATTVIYNRTRKRADELATEFDGKTGKVVAAPFEKLCDSCCHIFINASSVGMHPNVDASPLEETPRFSAETLVFDTIYNPLETKFLRTARESGAQTIGGIHMFVHQAARQFHLWTGHAGPTDIMRRVIEQRLAK